MLLMKYCKNNYTKVKKLCLSMSTLESLEIKKEKKSLYAASKNKDVINEILQKELSENKEILNNQIARLMEIASGTGEHCNKFVSSTLSNFPSMRLLYQPTENDTEMIPNILIWNEDYMLPKSDIVQPPFSFNIHEGFDKLSEKISRSNSISTLENQFNCLICINMVHITAFDNIPPLFDLAGKLLTSDGFLLTYGPYRVDNLMTEGNIRFDSSLKGRNPDWGIRDIEVLEKFAKCNGLTIAKIYLMPSNNMILIFKRLSSVDPKLIDSPFLVRVIDYYHLLPNHEEFLHLQSQPDDHIRNKLGEILLSCQPNIS